MKNKKRKKNKDVIESKTWINGKWWPGRKQVVKAIKHYGKFLDNFEVLDVLRTTEDLFTKDERTYEEVVRDIVFCRALKETHKWNPYNK